MASGKTVIKYQFFEVCSLAVDKETEELFDLSEWGQRVDGFTLTQKLKAVNEIKGRLEGRISVGQSPYEAYNFMRLDELSNTYKVKENKEAEHIDLADDEYIGKNTVVLYDPAEHIAMVQCNRGSYGVEGIVSYINQFALPNRLCYFRPVFCNFTDYMDAKKIVKLDIRFANTRNFTAYNSKCLERIVEACNEMEGLVANVSIGLGYAKNKALDAETVSAAVSDLRDKRNRECIGPTRIVLKDDVRSSVYDLFDNIDHELITYKIPPRGELSFEEMANAMAKRYQDESKERIWNSLHNKENA